MWFGESGFVNPAPYLIWYRKRTITAIDGMSLYQQKILLITKLHCKIVMFHGQTR